MDNIYPLRGPSLPSLLRLSLATPYTTGAPPTPPKAPADQPRYAHPWPDAIVGLGRRRVGPFDPCARACGRWSWVRYGTVVLCLPCADRQIAPLE